MKVNGLLCLLLAFILNSSPVIAQQSLLKHYTVKDGLPSNVIYGIFQDSRGFIWFCTEKGVSRFDGHHFKNFSTRDGLPDDDAFTIAEDGYGRCWVVCYNHRPCYIKGEIIYNEQNNKLCRQLASQNIDYTCVFRDKNGRSCLGGKTIAVVTEDKVILPYPAIRLTGGVFQYFSCFGKEYVVDAETVSMLSESGRQELFRGNIQTVLYADSRLYLFPVSESDMSIASYRFEAASPPHLQKVPAAQWIYEFISANDSEMLCVTDHGILRYDVQSGKISDSETPKQRIGVNRLLTDNESNNWFATLSDGVYMQPAAKPDIYQRTPSKNSNVVAVNISSTAQLIACYDDGSFDLIDANGRKSYTLPSSRLNNRIKYACQLSPQYLAICSDRGLYLVNTRTGKSGLIVPEAQKDAKQVGSRLLYAYSRGAGIYDLATRSNHLLWDQRTTAIAQDSNGNVWVGTLSGLYCLKGGQAQKFAGDSTLSAARITSLVYSPKNLLAIGTHKDGLFVLYEGKLLHLTEDKGISSNSCTRVETDAKGDILICSDKGLDRISFNDFPRFSVFHYSAGNGLLTNNINDVVVSGHKVFAATPEGVIAFSDSSRQRRQNPGIYILSLKLRDSLIDPAAELHLSYSQNDLQINYTGISFTSGDQVEYRYVLNGGSRDTFYTRAGTLNLSALKPGDYKLLIWAKADGQWSNNPAQCSFTISPPFWLTNWFILLASLTIAVIVIAIYRNKVDTVQKAADEKARRERKMAELEMQALRSQINPHFIFNALNSIQHFFGENDERKANHYLTLFAKLIRRTLNYSRQQWLSLHDELSLLKDYIELEKMRFKDAFEYRIICSPEIDAASVLVPALLIQPYVENAINHGLRFLDDKQGKLILRFDMINDCLRCQVDDNGIGINASVRQKGMGHKSLGMELGANRIEAINQLRKMNITVEVMDKSELAASGTLITIIIPQKDTYE